MSKIRTEIKRMDPKKLTYLKENARYMTHEQFKRLVQNVKNDGCLTSAPFVWHNVITDEYIVMSGNHRTKAAIEAGLTAIDVIMTSDPLTEAQRIAIQISHNSISGQDDLATLKNLYEKILDIDMKEYSGVDDKTLELLKKVKPVSIGEANLKFQTLSLVFLPDELEEAKKVLDIALKMTKSDEKWVTRFEQYDSWLDGIETAGAAYGVRNVATSLNIIFDIFNKNLDQLRDGWDHSESKKSMLVPFSTIIGVEKISVESAKIIAKACDMAVSRGECKSDEKWKLLEGLCSGYINRD